METTGTLANQLLIAMPGMADPNFSSTVTLICEHNDQGALGIVINRPLTLTLGGLFPGGLWPGGLEGRSL